MQLTTPNPAQRIHIILRTEETRNKLSLFAAELESRNGGASVLLHQAVKDKFRELGLTYSDAAKLIDPKLSNCILNLNKDAVTVASEFYQISRTAITDITMECITTKLTTPNVKIVDAVAEANRMIDMFLSDHNPEVSEVYLTNAVATALSKLTKQERYAEAALLGRTALPNNLPLFDTNARLAIRAKLANVPKEVRSTAGTIGMTPGKLGEVVREFSLEMLQSRRFYFKSSAYKSSFFETVFNEANMKPAEESEIYTMAFNYNLAKLQLRRASAAASLAQLSQDETQLLATQFCSMNAENPKFTPRMMLRIAKYFHLQTVLANKAELVPLMNTRALEK